MIYLLFITFLFIAELAYFKIADHYNIIDKPNHRSSHAEITIRGGGIIFPISILLWFAFSDFQYPLFVGGLLIISLVSFIDDLKDISRRLRLLVHVLAMGLVFWQLNLFAYNWILLIAIFLLFIGVINAYNFMDGINGITGVYSFIALITLLWVNQYQTQFIDTGLLVAAILGIVVFNFFNFRHKAVCFAGDIGSIAMAFIICFLLIKLIIQTGNVAYILLLAVYGVDAIYTIGYRLFKGENIFLAHRSHLYQLLVNERQLKHLTVASIYGLIQLLVNCVLINVVTTNNYQTLAILITMVLVIVYIIIRVKVNAHQFSQNT